MSAVGSVTADANAVSFHNGPVLRGAINLYPIWYNDTGASQTWPSGAQNVIRTFLNNVSSTHWWTTFQQYPDKWGGYATSATIAQECTDPGNEGTTEDVCNAPSTLPDVIANNLVGGSGSCNLPVDPNGLYLILPVSLSAFSSDGCHVHGVAPGTSTTLIGVSAYLYDCPYPSNPGCHPGMPTPNGLIGFGGVPVDGMIEFLSHEIAEAITDPTQTGWFGGGAEIADVCQYSTGGGIGGSGQNYYLTGGGQWADLPAGGLDFLVQSIWQRAPANLCWNGLPPSMPPPTLLLPYKTPFLPYGQVNCAVNASCAGGTYGNPLCLTGQCVQPSCFDGVLDGAESDIDCGAVCSQTREMGAGSCTAGKNCNSPFDCNTANCVAGVCAP